MKHSEFRYLMLKVFFNNISTIYKRNYFESFPGEELAIKLKFTKKKKKKSAAFSETRLEVFRGILGKTLGLSIFFRNSHQ